MIHDCMTIEDNTNQKGTWAKYTCYIYNMILYTR